mmetsp:Transcript_19344/g.23045  ORF Transcript_19344/g.23045 Transcript_19344/m.23045 type:complete len:93 (+) Transcript_19344:84-362(+)
MVHVLSLIVGAATSGTGFLLIHRQISHRSALSSRWLLFEKSEKDLKTIVTDAKSSMTSQTLQSESDLGKFIGDNKVKWNDGISQLRDSFGKK